LDLWESAISREGLVPQQLLPHVVEAAGWFFTAIDLKPMAISVWPEECVTPALLKDFLAWRWMNFGDLAIVVLRFELELVELLHHRFHEATADYMNAKHALNVGSQYGVRVHHEIPYHFCLVPVGTERLQVHTILEIKETARWQY
jgi:hypothetical protein